MYHLSNKECLEKCIRYYHYNCVAGGWDKRERGSNKSQIHICQDFRSLALRFSPVEGKKRKKGAQKPWEGSAERRPTLLITTSHWSRNHPLHCQLPVWAISATSNTSFSTDTSGCLSIIYDIGPHSLSLSSSSKLSVTFPMALCISLPLKIVTFKNKNKKNSYLST